MREQDHECCHELDVTTMADQHRVFMCACPDYLPGVQVYADELQAMLFREPHDDGS